MPASRNTHRSLSPLSIIWRTNARRAGAPTVFSQDVLDHLVLKQLLSQQFLQPGVLRLQLL
jgi:hypothetical protein